MVRDVVWGPDWPDSCENQQMQTCCLSPDKCPVSEGAGAKGLWGFHKTGRSLNTSTKYSNKPTRVQCEIKARDELVWLRSGCTCADAHCPWVRQQWGKEGTDISSQSALNDTDSWSQYQLINNNFPVALILMIKNKNMNCGLMMSEVRLYQL